MLPDAREGAGADGDVAAVRAVVPVAALAWAGSRFASLDAEERVAAAATRLVLLGRTSRLRLRLRAREGMARSVLRVALEEQERRQCWTRR